jgi:hypothetical protein
MSAVLAVLMALSLLSTLRLSLGSAGDRAAANPVGRLLTHPLWLVPLIVVAYLVLGYFLTGKLSPWPPTAFADLGQRFGWWAGVAGVIAVVTTELWLLWTPAEVLRRFATPERRAGLRYFHLFNLVVGGGLILYAALRQM